jgi:5-methyltetrahydrofolate--homocysteine methyltransferase
MREKVVVFDGATGTSLQSQQLTVDDFGGEQYMGCNEYLVRTKPSAIERVHADFLEVGCDVIETDSFGATPVVLAEYDLADQAYALNLESARIAKRMAMQFSTSDHPRYVAGSIGPTTKLPSLGHISFKELENSFYVQAKGLIEGGADLLVIETCQDLLQTKAALTGVYQYYQDARIHRPVITSVTIESMGTMLLGTEIAAALTALEPYDIAAIGLNCATGPKEMSEHIRYLCQNSPKPVFIMPNAGIPENIGGRAHYKLTPDEFTYYLSHFVKDIGVGLVGGCCGTTAEHLRKLVEAVGSTAPVDRKWSFTPSASSLYQSVPLHVDPAPVIIGERTNANGSKQFRDFLAVDDWEGMTGMAKQQVKEGAHVLDVCAAFVGRNELGDMRELMTRFATQVTAPLMIDTTELPVMEEALQHIGGRAIINSVNLEDGEERVAKVLTLCAKYGAAVVALTIDEQGMAKTVERKMAIAKRIRDLAVERHGLRDQDLIFDTLTFTLGSGDEEFRKAGVATLESIRELKRLYPGVYTSLGVSNISFGLHPHARHVLNSVFLHYAIEYGLDMAIVHASKILPLYKISKEEQEICRRLVFDERTPGSDPLQELLGYYSKKKTAPKKESLAALPIEEKLKLRIIDGDKNGLPNDLDEGLKKYTALEIINTHLLGGMKVVGELFGSGQMQLPFVLQSAEVMKSAVAYLEKFMDKSVASSKGTMIIATVKGDVHDIGKNLVDIILTNNGYRVVNLGIQCPLDRMVAAFNEHQADAIGMSGLLVKSTMIMKENLEVMNERGMVPPVILGGAALTRRYVDQDLKPIYRGDLYYANDAFDGLRFMEEIIQKKRAAGTGAVAEAVPAHVVPPANRAAEIKPVVPAVRSSFVKETTIPHPPFFGTKVLSTFPLEELFRYINDVALYRGQWQVRKGDLNEQDYRKLIDEKIAPERKRLERDIIAHRLLQPAVVYGYYPCQADGNSLIVYRPAGQDDPTTPWKKEIADALVAPDGRAPALEEWLRFTFPRQRSDRNLCIADFFEPVSSGRFDTLACQIVTMGRSASEHSKTLFDADKYQEYLYFHGMSVEAAEALAEVIHKLIRSDLGIQGRDAAEIQKLFSQQYQGSRYSFGYPACPNLEDQTGLFTLLRPERIGITLTEEFQLVPEQSTSAIVVHHPQAKYFSVA